MSSTTVHPTGDRIMPGFPAVTITTDKETAARLVASGAFAEDGVPTDEAITELTDEHRAVLDSFVGDLTPPDAEG